MWYARSHVADRVGTRADGEPLDHRVAADVREVDVDVRLGRRNPDGTRARAGRARRPSRSTSAEVEERRRRGRDPPLITRIEPVAARRRRAGRCRRRRRSRGPGCVKPLATWLSPRLTLLASKASADGIGAGPSGRAERPDPAARRRTGRAADAVRGCRRRADERQRAAVTTSAMRRAGEEGARVAGHRDLRC